jgi:hypothetical protein
MEQVVQIIDRFRSSAALEPLGGEVGELEAVWVSREGGLAGNDEAAVRMTWRQASNHFGLLMPLSRLLKQSGDLDGAAFALRLAVDEPHEPSPDGTTLWFEDLPTWA